jgi:anti-sigma regulatory factor (Ser/Thr protein kinase)
VVIFTGATTAESTLVDGAARVVRKGGDLAVLLRVLEDVARSPLEASVELPREPASAVRSRRFVRDTLAGWGWPDDENALLVVSELVTNAVVHAASPAVVYLRARGAVLRIEVADRGAGSPEPRSPAPEVAGGRGLLLVDALADAWGIDPLDEGKVVWAELSA